MASFFIRTRKQYWYLYEQSYVESKSIQTKINRSSYVNLGFDPEWPLEKAKTHCKTLNQQNRIKRKLNHSASAAERRHSDIKIMESLFLPESLVKDFYSELVSRNFGSESHTARIHSHWKYIQKMLNTLKLEPDEYGYNKDKFYRYFLDSYISPDYVNKLLRILNMFGKFVSHRRKLPYLEVPAPNSHVRNKIQEAYLEDKSYVGPSDPLTPDLLESVRIKLKPRNYNWLFMSVWFGLRPHEIDSLNDSNTWKVTNVKDTRILHVYQSKLTRVEKDKRWKHIPILYSEQKTALSYISSGIFKRPTRKALSIVFKQSFITTYAGRKGFVGLMFEKGQPVEAISAWLGHQDISTTWRKYRDLEQILLGKKIS